MHASDAEATVTTKRVSFEEVIMGQRPLSDQIQRGDTTIAGKPVQSALGLFTRAQRDSPNPSSLDSCKEGGSLRTYLIAGRFLQLI